ncbi:MAG: site-specific DNA-methyltransferase [bacterium]
MDKEQKITNNIKVINNDFMMLQKMFPQCFDKNGKFLIDKFQKHLQTKEFNFSTESYGLEWLGKSYARLLASDSATTLLKEDEKHNKKEVNKESQNLLIKGDNLEVLKHLVNAYYEKIKMIYIDPPYNTGTDGFVYQDDRKFTVEEFQQLSGLNEEKAKRILDFTRSKSNSHSAWLTFMYPRLYIAKQLLKDDGAIFISIDDNEVAQLRLLMDDIFGEENFLQQIIWQKKKGGSQDSQDLAKEHEYILIYTKNNWKIIDETKDFEEEEFSKNINSRAAKLVKLEKWGNHSLRTDRPTLYYAILDPKGKEFYPVAPNGKEGCWRKKPECLDKEHLYWQKDRKNRLTPYEVIYFDEIEEERKIIKIRTIFTEYGTTTDAVKEILSLFDGNKVFDTPKPVKLLKKLMSFSVESNGFILDYFSGSGTTGDAVMQLNAEDGGQRQYILVQLPELIDPKKSKTAYDFVKDELKTEPTIFEITKERLIRSAKKIKGEIIDKKINEKQREIKDIESKLDLEDKEQKIQQLKGEINALKEQDLGFKIYETIPIWENYTFEADELDDKNLFDESKLTEDDINALLTTWKTYDNIPLTVYLKSINLDGYTANYGNEKLYLMHKGFTTENLKQLLLKIDSDKTFNPKSIIAFGYHFDSKNLRELSENIKSYANKKHIDIEFVIRY